ncbi:MAG: hypothetical protein AAF196_13500 [Planctomycetota bacterium]
MDRTDTVWGHASEVMVAEPLALRGADRRKRQREASSQDPRMSYIETLDLEDDLYDRLHLDRSAKLELGRRLAEAWRSR